MAVLQYGAIVTEIKGSLGGHTFKKQGNSFVIQNKSAGYSKSKQLINPALGYAGYIFQLWGLLPDTFKEAWNTEALLVLFKDKYGNDVHISGRDLFTKLNLQLGAGYLMQSPPEGFNSNVSAIVISNGELVVSPQSASVSILIDSDPFSYIDITVEVSAQRLRAPVFQTRMLVKRQQLSSDGTINFTNEFFARYSYVQPGYYVRYYVTPLNEFGFKGVTQVIDLSEGVIVPSYELLSTFVLAGGDTSVITMDSTDIAGYLVNVYAIVSGVSIPPDNFAAATNLGLFAKNGDDQLILNDILKVVFPSVTADDYVRFYTILNKSGNNYGTPETITTQVSGSTVDFSLGAFRIIDTGAIADIAYSLIGGTGYSFRVFGASSSSDYPPDDILLADEIGDWDTSDGSPVDLAFMFATGLPDFVAGDYVRIWMQLYTGSTDVGDPQTAITRVVGVAVSYTIFSVVVKPTGFDDMIVVTTQTLIGYQMRIYAYWTGVGVPPDTIGLAEFIGLYEYPSSGAFLLANAIHSKFPGIAAGQSIRVWTILESQGVELSAAQTFVGTVTA